MSCGFSRPLELRLLRPRYPARMELDREFPGAKDKNVSQFVDATLMKRIDQSGFLDKLYK